MDEKETKKPEGEEKAPAAGDTPVGDEPKADEEVERLNADTERIEKAIAEKKNAEARAKLAGVTVGKSPAEEPKRDTDEQYANKLWKGEVNPLKEDGFI